MASGTQLPDLRLGGFTVGVWLSALAVLHLTATRGLLLAGAGAGLTISVWWARRYLDAGEPDAPGRATHREMVVRRVAWVAVAATLGIVVGASATAARVAVRDGAGLADLARERATVTVRIVVDDDPRPVVRAGRSTSYVVPASVEHLAVGGRPRPVPTVRSLVLATDPSWRGLLPGQRATVDGRLQPPRGGDLTSVVISVAGAPRLVGRPPWAQRAAGALRTGLQRASEPLSGQAAGLLPGLVDGDTSRLDPGLADTFRSTGMTHLVAVSGSNVAVVIGLVLLVVRWCRAGPRLAALFGAVALVGFVILVRPSPSVLRAAVMGALGLIALASGRPRTAVPGLAATVSALVVIDPALSASAGFTLSVFATGGLLLIAPHWRTALRARGVPAGLAEALAVPAAAQVACAPVIAGISGTVSVVAVPANLLAVPAVAPATVLGVVAALLSPVWLTGARFVAWLAWWPARWLVAVANVGAAVPAGLIPWPAGTGGALALAALLLVAILAVRRPAARRIAMIVTLATVLGAVPVRLLSTGWPPPGAVFVACDVGQGDALVLPTRPGQGIVIDTGPEPASVDRCLDQLDVRAVPLLVITHFHEDHVGGFAGVLHGREIAEVVAPPYLSPPAGWQQVSTAAAALRVPVVTARAGWTATVDGVVLRALAPTRLLTGTRSDPNNNSLVLVAEVRGERILLMGDAEVEEQGDLVAQGVPAVDVLKVAHHGSAYQDPRVFDAARPAVAVVSVGLGNPYGHPHLPTLDRISRVGARVVRTDISGDVAVVATGHGLAVVVHSREPASRSP